MQAVIISTAVIYTARWGALEAAEFEALESKHTFLTVAPSYVSWCQGTVFHTVGDFSPSFLPPLLLEVRTRLDIFTVCKREGRAGPYRRIQNVDKSRS